MARRYGRHTVETSNEDKTLFPDPGITKGELIDYYARVAEHMLPWLADRPLVLERFPDGIEAGGFYQKQAPDHLPDWIERVTVETRDGTQDLVVCRNVATLVHLANLAAITLHPWLSRRDRLDRPDMLVVDLDPSGDDFEAARRAAGYCKSLLDELELPAFLKTTGSRGLHVVVPLDRSADFDAVRELGRELAARLADRHPEALTVEQRKDKRHGRLYVDVGRNAWAQTAVAPYAVRARPGAPVATPLDWDELDRRDLDARRFTVRNLFRRLGSREDPWRGMRRRARSLRAARRALERLRARPAR